MPPSAASFRSRISGWPSSARRSAPAAGGRHRRGCQARPRPRRASRAARPAARRRSGHESPGAGPAPAAPGCGRSARRIRRRTARPALRPSASPRPLPSSKARTPASVTAALASVRKGGATRGGISQSTETPPTARPGAPPEPRLPAGRRRPRRPQPAAGWGRARPAGRGPSAASLGATACRTRSGCRRRRTRGGSGLRAGTASAARAAASEPTPRPRRLRDAGHDDLQVVGAFHDGELAEQVAGQRPGGVGRAVEGDSRGGRERDGDGREVDVAPAVDHRPGRRGPAPGRSRQRVVVQGDRDRAAQLYTPPPQRRAQVVWIMRAALPDRRRTATSSASVEESG